MAVQLHKAEDDSKRFELCVQEFWCILSDLNIQLEVNLNDLRKLNSSIQKIFGRYDYSYTALPKCGSLVRSSCVVY